MAKRVICPDCGSEMNHHADKIDYAANFSHPELIDPEIGAVIDEAHTCAHCGKSYFRSELKA